MMELADMQDLGSCAARRRGSSPLIRIKKVLNSGFLAMSILHNTTSNKFSQYHELEMSDEDVGRFLKSKSPEDFMRDIEAAEKQYVSGEYSSAEEEFDELEQSYEDLFQ